jgi:hypothetical protein
MNTIQVGISSVLIAERKGKYSGNREKGNLTRKMKTGNRKMRLAGK